MRVLAAALLTAAIATVVGMSAFFDTPSEAGRPISAPPSSLQRSVRLTAHLAPSHRQRTAQLATKRSKRSAPTARPAVVSQSLAVVRHKPRPARPPVPRELADASPAPAPAAAPAPPASPSPAPQPPPVQAQGDDDAHGKGKGQGHAYGHDKQDE